GLALGVVLVALTSTPAEASCANLIWLGTPTGASIPARGSLYMYDDANARPELGGPIVAQTKVSDHVVRLDYATRADELEVMESVFAVNKTWRPPAAAPRVIQAWHHQ